MIPLEVVVKRFLLAVLTTLSIASPAAASTFDLGTLGPLQLFGNSYGAFAGIGTGPFTDYYTFNLNQPANLGGQTITFDIGSVNLDLNQVAFYQAGQSTAFATDTTPGSFSLSNLASGNYVMAITGTLGGSFFATGVGSYAGALTESAAAVSATPLPSTWGMMVLGLGVLGYLAFRGKRAGVHLARA
jgi:PEP-CTERM motif-containing protein